MNVRFVAHALALVRVTAGASNADWGPTVDGIFLPDQPGRMLANGLLNPGVSVMWGANTNDSALPFELKEYVGRDKYIKRLNATLHGYEPPGVSEGASRRELQRRRHKARLFGMRDDRLRAGAGSASRGEDLLKRALELYPPHKQEWPRGNNAASIGWFDSDHFLCSARRQVLAASKAVSNGGKAFLYRYYANVPHAATGARTVNRVLSLPAHQAGACHASYT